MQLIMMQVTIGIFQLLPIQSFAIAISQPSDKSNYDHSDSHFI